MARRTTQKQVERQAVRLSVAFVRSFDSGLARKFELFADDWQHSAGIEDVTNAGWSRIKSLAALYVRNELEGR